MKIKNLIVGAGISGIVLAEKLANEGESVLIIDKRNHIGGNCYDFLDEEGLLVPLYGPHFFHTNDEVVREYINKFSERIPYEHRVLSNIDGETKVPIPVNINTVNTIFETNIKNEGEMKKWIEYNREKIENPKNSEESALARVGKTLYNKLFKNYTKKQRDLWPEELDASVMDRIPVRTDFDDRYFTDKHQYMPKNGYTKLFENMIRNKNIQIKLNTDFDEYKDKKNNFDKIFFTGRIDNYFKDLYGPLEYRSLNFEFETLNQEFFQESTSINYPNTEKFTRITEPKHATGQKHNKTTIIKEYSTWEGEPYYPVPRERNKKLYEQYKDEAKKLEKNGIYFVGRLAEYKYFNMDQTVKNALDLIHKIQENEN